MVDGDGREKERGIVCERLEDEMMGDDDREMKLNQTNPLDIELNN